ncbi:MAG: ABC transporter ATP-binding protein [Candidatus Paceibacterota bacterium]
MLGVFGFIILSQALNACMPYLQSKIIDGLVQKAPIRQVGILAIISLVLWVLRSGVLQWAQDRYELAHVDYEIPRRMQEVMLEKLLGFSIGQLISENSGVKQSIIVRGEKALDNLVHSVLYQILPLAMEILLATALLFYWSIPIGLVVATTVVVYLGFVARLNGKFKDEMVQIEKLFVADQRLHGETLRNIGLIIASAQEERAKRECKESLGGAFDFARSVWNRYIVWAAIRNTLPVIARFIVLSIVIVGGLHGKYSIGEFVLFMTWTVNATGNLGSLSQIHRRSIQDYTSAKQYFDMLAIKPDITEIENPIRPEKFAGRIEFKNVTFRYGGRDSQSDEEDDKTETTTPTAVGPALDDVSFVIEAGETVAFIGESGAGKSTLVNALIRAQDPESGQITVDDNDLRDLDLKHYRGAIGIVAQDVGLFDQTLRYNITYNLNGHAADFGDHELNAVAEMSCLDRFFHRLEKGFDTVIGERGVKLSGGERQRVGIARAIVKEPQIMIFDEATCSLDSGNERLIQESINKVSKGRTTIIIAHRFSTIRNVDKVIVFDKGKLVDCGTHEELAERCEVYQYLSEQQDFVL